MDYLGKEYRLSLSEDALSEFPAEFVEILKHNSSARFLEALAELALHPGYTETVFSNFKPIFVELCSQWVNHLGTVYSPLRVVSSLARVLPVATYLSLYVEEIACNRRAGEFAVLFSSDATALSDIPEQDLVTLLGTLFRLMQFDDRTFECLIPLSQIRVLLRHTSPRVRLLSTRVLCLFTRASDLVLHSMVMNHLGEGAIYGEWDGKAVDYRLLSLWEEQRLNSFANRVRSIEQVRQGKLTFSRTLEDGDFSNNTPRFTGILVPGLSFCEDNSHLVMTPTSALNVRDFACALQQSRPLLITGLAGCGKTSLVRYFSNGLDASSMITLYLNDQTDAKSLIGMYVSNAEPGSFKWQPGVLTTAVLEGRWVLIEDIDRAPPEVMGILLPLLDRGELLVPHLGGWIRANRGFQLIGTLRTFVNARGEEVEPRSTIIGLRHWLEVKLRNLNDQDLAEIIVSKYPILVSYLTGVMSLYKALRSPKESRSKDLNLMQAPGPQQLLQFCSRLASVLKTAGVKRGHEAIPDTLQDNMFLEAVDCFSASSRSQHARTHLFSVIAKEMSFSSDRALYCLESRVPSLSRENRFVSIGRVTLPTNQAQNQFKRYEERPFAITNHTLRYMESIGSAILAKEPCLLVGETGTGKTTIIQELANTLGQKLIVVNLSQQSEASDLLGGFKPVSARATALPMQDEFRHLFERSVSSSNNDKFMSSLERSIRKEDWSRVITLWREAIKKVKSVLQPNESSEPNPKKRRKLDTPKYQRLIKQWDDFESGVEAFNQSKEGSNPGFHFKFVEGNIVKAVRAGYWVLLDEINLASTDTLEALAGLFVAGDEAKPSLLLTETGNPQKIEAHPNFRIFGAMNPATDVGKRDLPPSLKSRFTEYYVRSPDRDQESLEQIVRAYLPNRFNEDVRIPADVAGLYRAIKSLEENNLLVDGAEQKPHFSLRTLTRTLTYAKDIAPLYGLRRALFEGFSMSFLTFLDMSSSSRVLQLIDTHILSQNKNNRAMLRQVPKQPKEGKHYVQFRHYWMRCGSHEINEQPLYIITPFVEANLLNLVRATSTRQYPVLLQGPTSSGKTSMVEYLANISGNHFVRINNHENTDLQEYLGTYVSSADGLHYQEGVLVRALREGHWIVLDELNLAPTDVLEALNRLLDDNRELLIPETQEIVRPHINFMLFATQNPPGLYGGRKVLSRAFRNRFLELHFDDIPEDELETILIQRTKIAPSFGSRIVSVYKRLSIMRQANRMFEHKNSFATLRDLFRWALRDADTKEELATYGFMLLGERVRNPDERLIVKQVIEEVMRTKIDLDHLYSPEVFEKTMGPGNHPISSRMVWTSGARRLWVLIHKALEHNEPVLLVGGTGIGKTSICQAIAESSGTQLHILNAHQNTETGDLIGAQRPLRNRSKIETELRDTLLKLMQQVGSTIHGPESSLAQLVKAYSLLSKEVLVTLPQGLVSKIEQGISHMKTLFEWSDGSLVKAMKNGEHFLLDEISLADDSVLERLNSVLEPERRLLLAEKGPEGALVESSMGFQFLATMNPGGDYGKKELSPALRNRFTEIWVPSVTNEDILDIVRAKLKDSAKKFAVPMLQFAEWFGRTFKDTSGISLREMLSWVVFVNESESGKNLFCLLHGAAMVFIDAIGANPSATHATDENAIHTHRRSCLNQLDKLFGYDMTSMYYAKPNINVSDSQLQAGDFELERRSNTSVAEDFSFTAETTRENAFRVLRALKLEKPILIEGSPGVGKTTLVAAIAGVLGIPLTRVNLSDQTDVMDLFGSDVPVENGESGQFTWSEAPFLRAMQRGDWVLLDEMNLASQSILEGLNACLDHRGETYIPELDRTFTKHPNFRIFAAQNPHSQGGGRKGLPASFVNRFTIVYAQTLNNQDMASICAQIHPNFHAHEIESMVNVVGVLSALASSNGALNIQGGPWEFNLRDILRCLHIMGSSGGLISGAAFADVWDFLFLHRLRDPYDVEKARLSMLSKSTLCPSNHTYFINLSERWYQCGYGILPVKKMTRTRFKNRRWIGAPILESLMMSVQQGWPSLLVGTSGSGKTRLIYHLASRLGEDIIDLPLNAESDTMDILGGYEQSDNERKLRILKHNITEKIRELLLEAFSSATDLLNSSTALESNICFDKYTIGEMKAFLDRLRLEPCGSAFDDLYDECEKLGESVKLDDRARFEWIDGALIQAVEQGKWLVLDNANLCGPSVLDRLNSLLEPNGILVVNENRNPDGSVRQIKPHPNFRLFLTVDPRYGEVSRAMRNRCIELYLPPQELPKEYLGILGDESLWFRFKAWQTIEWSHLSPRVCRPLAFIVFESLSFKEVYRLDALAQALEQGLMSLRPDAESMFRVLIVALGQLRGATPSVIDYIRTITTELAQKALPTNEDLMDFVLAQPIHPLNNAPLVSLIGKNEQATERLISLGAILEQKLELHILESSLSSLTQAAGEKPAECLSRLERSILSSRHLQYSKDSTRHLNKFFLSVLMEVDATLNKYLDIALPKQSRFKVDELVFFLSYFFEICRSQKFHESEFQAYLVVARALGDRLSDDNLVRGLGESLKNGLALFDSNWKLSSGTAMGSMWLIFRPPTATNVEELNLTLNFEALADEFDKLAMATEASTTTILRLRTLFVEGFEKLSHYQSTPILQDIEAALREEKTSHTKARSQGRRYLKEEFTGLRQYMVSGESNHSLNAEIDLFAGRSTQEEFKWANQSLSSKRLFALADFTGIGSSDTALLAARQVLPIRILQKALGLPKISVEAFFVVKEELNVLTKVVSQSTGLLTQDQFEDLNLALLALHKDMAQAHTELLDSSSMQLWGAHLLENNSHTTSAAQQRPYFSDKDSTQHFVRIVQKYFVPSLEQIRSEFTNNRAKVLATAASFVSFFTGALFLYVPDRDFDPALTAIVNNRSWSERIEGLNNKLAALKVFERHHSGCDTNLRSELVSQVIQNLGNEPEYPKVVRPESSRLTHLQGIFTSISNSILPQCPDHTKIIDTSLDDKVTVNELSLLRDNLNRLISRLSSGFREYDDIVKPALAMLQGLDIGIALAITGMRMSIDEGAGCSSQSVQSRDPTFLGLRLIDAISATNLASANVHGTPAEDIILSLREAIIEARVDRSCGLSHQPHVCDLFDSLFSLWKKQLSFDQEKYARNTSLYHYKGDRGNSEEENQREFELLFPDFDTSGTENVLPKEAAVIDTQALANSAADLQAQLFTNKITLDQDIIGMALCLSDRLVRTNDISEYSFSQVSPAKLLPSMILGLHKAWSDLSNTTTCQKYNFYEDSNLNEMTKLYDLLQRISSRFKQLKTYWPEYVTLVDVLDCVTDIMNFQHTEPLAKFLTKSEKLHGFVHEWQVVASSEHSVASLYDELTDILVSWRRVELSTWSRLLDIEDEKCLRDANSWWFIAYEAIIQGAFASDLTFDSISVHLEQLLSQLRKFMESTALGQFAARLQLIHHFAQYVSMLNVPAWIYEPLSSAMQAFVCFYRRFEPAVLQTIAGKRELISKELKEIVLLASWKDTNITALRESAKRAHFKLFKVVRKYRALLAEPANSVLQKPAPGEINHRDDLSTSDEAPECISKISTRAVKLIETHFPNWNMQLPRYRDLTGTAKIMQLLWNKPRRAVEYDYLELFSKNLMDSIKELRKETPQSLTKENTNSVKHLKTRKRKLFADTLKELRRMGLRSNVDTETLHSQKDIPTILSKLEMENRLESALRPLFGLLDRLDSIRTLSKTPSGDLTKSEVAKSVSIFESLLSVLLSQRKSVLKFSRELACFDQYLGTAFNFHNTIDSNIHFEQSQDAASSKITRKRLRWLQGALQAASSVLKKQQEMGGTESSQCSHYLEFTVTTLKALENEIDELPSLPHGLTSELHLKAFAQFYHILRKLHDRLNNGQDSPNVSYVTNHIASGIKPLLWELQENGPTIEPGIQNLEKIHQNFLNVVDSMLVGIQNLNSVQEGNADFSQEHNWLAKTNAHFSKALTTMQLPQMAQKLDEFLDNARTQSNEESSIATALFSSMSPILSQYREAFAASLAHYHELHVSLCNLGYKVSISLCEILSSGFCSPSEESNEQGANERLEEGTGLGEGEGEDAEDISKDIAEDEDLSELAQGEKKKGAVEEEKDAIDMGADELEGEPGEDEGSSDEGDEDGSSEKSGDDIDEEIGSVDDLDPSAVDEKIWDGKNNDREGNEKDSSKQHGEKGEDMVANEGKSDETMENNEDNEDNEEAGLEESEEVQQEETQENEQVDPHTAQEEKLDLPEDLNMDEDVKSVHESDDDFDKMSQATMKDMKDDQEDAEEAEEFQDGMRLDDIEDEISSASDEQEDYEKKQEVESGRELDQESENGLKLGVDNATGKGQGEEEKDLENTNGELPQDLSELENRHSTNEQDETDEVGGVQGLTGTEREAQSAAQNPNNSKQEDDGARENKPSESFKKLGDALETWHRLNKNIQDASQEAREQAPDEVNADNPDQEFEHLPDENADADAQALGESTVDQTQVLDKEQLDSERQQLPRDFQTDDLMDVDVDQDVPDLDLDNNKQELKPPTFANNLQQQQSEAPESFAKEGNKNDDGLEDLDNDLSTVHLDQDKAVFARNINEARQLWSKYEAMTRDLALSLTEQLRLILEPTLASKMRGDFRTGKRLNIKRIIPYIASQYKRDKIWMRRSIPSKRNYQIMIALDDSKSMGESGCGRLAFETLALVSKSLSMLEVGQLCIVGFGSDIQVAHEFDQPFSSEAGAQAFRHFGFVQTTTNVYKLMQHSLSIFREARAKNSNNKADLWQLQLIISDGICENHDSIRRLVRQAHEERIMIVFVIIDGISSQSITAMDEASFEKQENGEMKLKIRRYLDKFPFGYYLIVGDVNELPRVLATALRQWFAEVVDSA